MLVRRYTWASHHAPAPHLAAARHHAPPGQAPRWHDHDYYELFWVESGRGRHCRPEGDEALRAGDGRCLRPSDVHTFATDGHELRWMNLAIAAPTMRVLRGRYREELGWWPWDGDAPHGFHLPRDDRARLIRDLALLPTVGQRRLEADWIVLGILRCLEPPGLPTHGPPPAWLREAIAAIAYDARALQLGIPALVRAAGHSERHCNRALRKHHGISAGALIRQLRLEYAARLLHWSARPITDLALESGFEHLGTFYRCFKQRYGLTPRAFRLRSEVG